MERELKATQITDTSNKVILSMYFYYRKIKILVGKVVCRLNLYKVIFQFY